MLCQCEYILCTEMGLLSPNHGDRRDGFGKQIKSNNNNPVLGHFAFDTSSVCQFTISLEMERPWHGACTVLKNLKTSFLITDNLEYFGKVSTEKVH